MSGISWTRGSSLKPSGIGLIYGDGMPEFDYAVEINIRWIGYKGNKTFDQMKLFNCYECALEHQPPEWDIQTVINKMPNLLDLQIGLNMTDEQSLNDVLPNQPSYIHGIDIRANQLTIKTGALKYLEDLSSISFNGARINRIERESFKRGIHSNFTSDGMFFINFRYCKLSNGTFQSGSFDGIQGKWVQITFDGVDISSLPENAFKSLLNSTSNSIALIGDSNLDCDDCKNYWLIKEKKEKQIINAHCKSSKKTLFDQENQTKLGQKCK